MPRRTRRELAAENAVLFGKLEQVRDDLEEFLDDATDEEVEDESEGEDGEEDSEDSEDDDPDATTGNAKHEGD